MELFLSDHAWNESEVFSRGAPVIGDSDTGNPALAVFDESICHRLSGEQRPARQDVHLGRLYRYRPRLMKVGVEDGKRQRVIERVVEGVESWNDPARNPFKLANPHRQGFRRPGFDVPVALPNNVTSPKVPVRMVAALKALINPTRRTAPASPSFVYSKPRLLRTWPVSTEAFYLVGRLADGMDKRFFWDCPPQAQFVSIPQMKTKQTASTNGWSSIRDTPMDFADTSLVLLAEQSGI